MQSLKYRVCYSSRVSGPNTQATMHQYHLRAKNGTKAHAKASRLMRRLERKYARENVGQTARYAVHSVGLDRYMRRAAQLDPENEILAESLSTHTGRRTTWIRDAASMIKPARVAGVARKVSTILTRNLRS